MKTKGLKKLYEELNPDKVRNYESQKKLFNSVILQAATNPEQFQPNVDRIYKFLGKEKFENFAYNLSVTEPNIEPLLSYYIQKFEQNPIKKYGSRNSTKEGNTEMKKKQFKGKYDVLFEQTLYRYQQGGFLRGDYVRIKSSALNHPIVKQMSDQVRAILSEAQKSDTYYRISYIKSGHSEAMNGPVDAANIPAAPLWADVYHEYAPGMWKDPLTLPLEVLEKVNIGESEGYAQYPDSIKRDNNYSNDEAKEVDITMGKDSNRKLTRTNVKLANTSAPKDGRSQTKLSESIKMLRENDMIFETMYALVGDKNEKRK